jgi:sugar-specific transcriptional regulator TrmB
MDENEAIAGLKQLGLTTYEARVFVALQKLGAGTASEISSVVDVPRSQVYGAAEGLEERGLVETQQSTPTAYRPVPLEQARRLLLDQLAETGAEIFNYLERVQDSHETEERSESIWLISARDAIVSRTVEIAESADERLLYGVESVDMLEDDVLDALVEATGRGVSVIVVSANQAVLDAVPRADGYSTRCVPEDRNMDVDTGRLRVADGRTVLLSTRSVSAMEEDSEVAFWTSDNPFASLFVELVEAWLRDPFEP